jgi:hypothetical protein
MPLQGKNDFENVCFLVYFSSTFNTNKLSFIIQRKTRLKLISTKTTTEIGCLHNLGSDRCWTTAKKLYVIEVFFRSKFDGKNRQNKNKQTQTNRQTKAGGSSSQNSFPTAFSQVHRRLQEWRPVRGP